jgi:hypothetical protein
MLMHPSYVDRIVGFQPFPSGRRTEGTSGSTRAF